MITYVDGNLFESPASFLVNTVNTVGVMGKGVALHFRRLYPAMFAEYRTLCENQQLKIGTLWLYRTPHKSVLNFPTKQHWRAPSRVEFIEAGLRTFVRYYEAAGIESAAFPALGCGNGGLDFEHQVRPLMERYLKPLKARILIYPHRRSLAVPEHADVATMRNWLSSAPRDLSFVEVWDQLSERVGVGMDLAARDGSLNFHVAPSVDPKGFTVKWGDVVIHVDYDELLDLWQELRALGFVDGRIGKIDSSVSERAVQSLLSLLPYVKPVRLASDYTNEGSFSAQARYGLQFIPETGETSPEQLSLSTVA